MPAEPGDRGYRGFVLPAVVLCVVVAGAVAAGVAFADTNATPAGTTLLDDSADQYRSANTLTGVANVTVSNATEERSATVEYAVVRPDSVRLTVTHNDTTATVGTNGSVAWASAPVFGVERTWPVDDASKHSHNVTAACEAARSHAMAFAANHSAAIERGIDATRERNITVPETAPNLDEIDCGTVAEHWNEMKKQGPTSLADANLTATTTGSTTVDGVAAYVVSVEPRNRTSDYNATVVIAKNDSRLLETRLTDGENATVVRYGNQHFNASIDDSTFAPPSVRENAGTVTYDDFDAAQSNTDRDLPTLDADGYAFERAVLTHAGSGTTVAQRYTDGARNATVVSTDSERVPYDALNGTNITVGGNNATVATMRGRSVVAWTDDGITYALVTNGSTDDATVLARTVST